MPRQDLLDEIARLSREKLDATYRAVNVLAEAYTATRVELRQAYANLTAVQARCTELLLEVRELRAARPEAP